MRILLLIILLIPIAGNSQVTESQDNLENDLRFYADVMVNALESKSRTRAQKLFYDTFTSVVKSGHVGAALLDSIAFISVVEPNDKAFKLISWQVQTEPHNYRYYAYVLFPDKSYQELLMTEVLDSESTYLDIVPAEWYGALYYKVMKHDEGRYLLFGFNADSKYNSKKVLDVLTLSPNNEISMGAEIFEDKETEGSYLNRLILNYSSDANVNLNYNPGLGLIIFDHLEHRMGLLPGQGPTFLPDGTYEGFEKKGDKWMYLEKIYNHQYDEAPRPNPVLLENKTEEGAKTKGQRKRPKN